MKTEPDKIIKNKMTKEHIERIKSVAKKRKNRSLSDGEAARVMAKASSAFGWTEDLCQEAPVVELTLTDDGFKYLNGRTIYVPPARNPKKQIVRAGNVPVEPVKVKRDVSKNKGRRLSKKQYLSLMKKASVELGINDRPHSIMDLDRKEKELTIDELMELTINVMLRYGMKNEVKDFRNAIRNKRLTNGDKLAILSYVYFGKGKRCKIPMALIKEKERCNDVRKVVKPWGDIKERPERYMPDEEYFREERGETRTKRDAFDKLSDDKKIEWARYANLIVGFGENSRNPNFVDSFKVRTKADCDVATIAMRYACKMMNMAEFKDIFANPFWIFLRILKYYNAMTNKEHQMWFDMAIDYLGINQKRFIPILSRDKVVSKLEPTLKNLNLYNKFLSVTKKSGKFKSKLEIAKNMIKESVNEGRQRTRN